MRRAVLFLVLWWAPLARALIRGSLTMSTMDGIHHHHHHHHHHHQQQKPSLLVTYRSPRHDGFLAGVAQDLKCPLSYLSSASEIHAPAADSVAGLLVLDAHAIRSEADVNLIKSQSNAIFVMHEDEEASVAASISADSNMARSACLYDLYVGAAAASQRQSGATTRLRKLLECLNAASTRADSPYSLQDTLLDAGEWSHFVSLTFPSIDDAVDKLPLLRIGADAIELRVDLLADSSIISIQRQIALLRDTCPLPIVFTVRSVGQIGKFPAEPTRIFALLRQGLRAGAEWIDVEACWPADQTDAFTQLAKSQYRCTSRLLGSLHVTVPQRRDEIDGLFRACDLKGRADMIKTVTGADDLVDCQRIHESGASMGKPYIGVCLGAKGSQSRVLNRRFTPVTHECMAVAAPGQLTVKQLMTARIDGGLLVPKKYFLFGTPIQQSLSPSMHNSAYKALALPHIYGLNEQSDVNAYKSLLHDASFGGASVTIPHKETVLTFLDEVRGAAQQIGAVNTIVVEEQQDQQSESKTKRWLVGYNTDWIGIRRPILTKLRSRQHMQPAMSQEVGIGLVVGAGGTARAACYAVQSLGLRLYVTNRSPDKGREIATMFGGTFVDMDALKDLNAAALTVVISTVPAAAGFTLPFNLVEHKPVILDVVYKPAKTALMQQAMDANCPLVQGATMLLNQGLEQFELWNKRRAPFAEMDAAIFAGVERLDR